MSELASSHAGGAPGHRVGAIIVAAGHSRRMSGVDKLFAPLLGVPLLSYTLEAFQAVCAIQDVALVLSRSNLELGKALVADRGFHKVSYLGVGGQRRQDSVRSGLELLPPCDWVVVHDGARPCVEPQLIERGLEEARRWGSAVAAVPVHDTLKVASAQGEVTETLNREGVWAVQTPQIFSWETLQKAHRQEDVTVTDDAVLVERLGEPVHLYLGSYENNKVTTPEDVRMAEAVLRQRRGLSP